ncbi:MAG: hypothetical protein H0V76_11560 [Blastocatellia bacterium]|nr:hypothetical protein [Blastocatellia bacterium]
MKLKSFLYLIFVSLFGVNGFGQAADAARPPAGEKTAQQVIDRYIEAIGGRKALEAVNSRSTKGTVEIVPMGMTGTFETVAAPETRSVTKLNLAGIGEMLEGSDGTNAWAINPIQGSRERAGKELEQYRLINYFRRELDLNKLYDKIELKGTEKVGERTAAVIVMTKTGLPPETAYFDQATGLLIRSDSTILSPEGQSAMTTYYEDARKVDGISVPFLIRTVTPQFEIRLTVNEVKHNIVLTDNTFVMPKT